MTRADCPTSISSSSRRRMIRIVALAARALLAGKHVVVEEAGRDDARGGARRLASAARDTDRVRRRVSRVGDGTATFSPSPISLNARRPRRRRAFRIALRSIQADRPRSVARAGGPGGGLWYDLGPHLVDQALQLFGLPDRVTANLAAQRSGRSPTTGPTPSSSTASVASSCTRRCSSRRRCRGSPCTAMPAAGSATASMARSGD